MFANFIKVAVRNLLKYKAYSAINILGLATGLASFILIIAFVLYEFSYDRHHQNADHIVRVAMDLNFGGSAMVTATVPAPLAATMVSDYPEVKNAARFRDRGSYLVRKADSRQNFKETDIIFADPQVLELFTIPIVEGATENLLVDPSGAIISQQLAQKYYGDASPIGQTLVLDHEDSYVVEAVFADMPENSQLNFDMMLAMASLPEGQEESWLNSNFVTFLLLEEHADPRALAAKLPEMVVKYVGPQIEEITGRTLAELEAGGNHLIYQLERLPDIHLYSSAHQGLGNGGDIAVVLMFLIIAIAILLIACVNFMNLATARSVQRAREVGVRKVLGSRKGQLVWQFLAESVLLSAIAMIVALVLVELLMPTFQLLSDRPVEIDYLANPWLLPAIVLLTMVVGLIAGSYPALFLSGFQPVGILKGQSGGRSRSGKLRSALVVFQFSASIVLLIATIVVQGQLSFIRNKKLGFDKDQVLVIQDAYALGKQTQAFKQEIIHHPDITSASVSGFLPVSSNRSSSSFWPNTRLEHSEAVLMQIWKVDEDYLSTFKMDLLVGRDFDGTRATDSTAMILNESAVALFGWDDAIGKKVIRPGDESFPAEEFTVIGVIRDFHFESLKENIGALAMRLKPSGGSISLRLAGNDYSGVIDFLRTKWELMGPGQPFAYSFLDQRFDEMYRSEETLRSLFGVFATIAILIACLGLLALTAFTTEQRTKEIGVRKVLGASMASIIAMLSREFIKWVVISNLVAWPIAALIMHGWLQDFVYRIDLSWWIFAAAGLASLLITALTVSVQSIKAAVANPVESLRYE